MSYIETLDLMLAKRDRLRANNRRSILKNYEKHRARQAHWNKVRAEYKKQWARDNRATRNAQYRSRFKGPRGGYMDPAKVSEIRRRAALIRWGKL